jgi:hypothetical protein
MVPGDRSPQPGPGLDAPARPDDLAAAAPTARRPPPPEPSLARVFATTLRLWLRRRVLRVADDAPIGALRWTAATAAVLIVAGAVGGGVAVALPRSALSRSALSPSAQPAARQNHHAPQRTSPAQAESTASEQAAAAWMVAQVASGTTVYCDVAMCTALQTAGFPATQLAILGPGSTLPAASKHTPAGLVVETAAAYADLGRLLPAAAPQVLASFGKSPELVQVRVIGGTPAAFRVAARAAIAADAKSGRNLAREHRLHLAGTARAELGSGLVDPRLVFLLGRLVAVSPVYVTGFFNANPGVAWPAELRAVTITGLVLGSGRHRVSTVGAVLRLLRSQPARYRAVIRQGSGPGGEVALTIGFLAPGPL